MSLLWRPALGLSNHPALNPLVPAIMINCSSVEISIYDCVKDVLFMSQKIEFLEINQSIKVLQLYRTYSLV